VLLACGLALAQEADTHKEHQESERSMVKSEGLRRRVTPLAAGLVLVALLAVLTVLWGARPAEAAFPGANGLIAYEADDFWEGSRINAIDPTTGDEITLSESEDYSDWGPAWSADGHQIAFIRNSEIYVMDADPSTNDSMIRLTNNNVYDAEPAWSPRGGKIAFESDRDGDFEIYVMDTDPTTDDAIKLTNNNVDDRDPAWSPRGGKIAFTRNSEIYVMDPDPSTKDITRITKNNTGGESPDWSPSGRKIVFEGSFEGKHGILVMNEDGSRRKALTRGGYEPVWSPDGRKIAFVRWVWAPEWGYEGHLHVMNKDGSRDKTLTFGDDYSPTWQPIVR